MILTSFPSPAEFYKTYWNKKPFVVRGGIPADLFDDLIDGDTLAGLALEEDIKSRLVLTSPEGGAWSCEHGPFAEDRFSKLGETNWSLLVQNVEQYHEETAALLRYFNMSPRWLMDDIMVSYSAAQGSVGPHTDSYHVFLVQGIGKRQWRVGHAPIENEELIEGQDLKVLKTGFAGDAFDVTTGDVIYIPPHFAHEGVTQEAAMTFSVGFLGPQLSDMLAEFGQFFEERESQNKRYSGAGLDADSRGFSISQTAQQSIQNDLIQAIQSDVFSTWMAEYFSRPTHDDAENLDIQPDALTPEDMLSYLEEGGILYKPDHIKLTLADNKAGTINVAAFGRIVLELSGDEGLLSLVQSGDEILNQNIPSAEVDKRRFIENVTALYNNGVLFLYELEA